MELGGTSSVAWVILPVPWVLEAVPASFDLVRAIVVGQLEVSSAALVSFASAAAEPAFLVAVLVVAAVGVCHHHRTCAMDSLWLFENQNYNQESKIYSKNPTREFSKQKIFFATLLLFPQRKLRDRCFLAIVTFRNFAPVCLFAKLA